MDIRSIDPELNLFNREWPVRTANYSDPPAKFAFNEKDRRGQAIDTVIGGGGIVSGGLIKDSVIGRNIRVHAGAEIDGCIIFDNCDIGRGAKLRRCILEKNVSIPDEAVIGFDLDEDSKRYHVTESGIVVVEGLRTPVSLTTINL